MNKSIKPILSSVVLATAQLSFASSYHLIIPLDKTKATQPVNEVAVALSSAPNIIASFGDQISLDLMPLVRIKNDNPVDYGAVTFSSVSPLQTGLRLDGNLLTGNAEFLGNANVVLEVDYKGKKAKQSYKLTVSANFTLASESFPGMLVGVPTIVDIGSLLNRNSNGPLKTDLNWEIQGGQLPDGLNLSATTGLITGTATQPGNYEFTVTASQGVNRNSETYNLSVSLVEIDINPTAVPTGYVSEDYDFNLLGHVGVNGDANYDSSQLSLSSVQLPVGLSLTDDGRVTGSPTMVSNTSDNTEIVARYKGLTKTAMLTIPVKMRAKLFSGYYAWADGSYAESCNAYRNPTNAAYVAAAIDGKYRIQPKGWEPVDVICDMNTDGGGWTLTSWNKGTSLNGFNANVFVSNINKASVADLNSIGTKSLNPELFSKTVITKDAMLIVPAMSSLPYIERNQGVWSYDLPDCAGTLGHTGRKAGCTNHGANDNWDSSDKYNIAIYTEQADGQKTNAIVPAYVSTHTELCYSKYGMCDFYFYLR